MSIVKRFSAVAVLVLMASPARASSLSLPRVVGEVMFTRPAIFTETADLGEIGLSDPLWGLADLTITGMPAPAITAEAFSGSAAGSSVSRGVGILEYAFEIVSATAVQAPVLVTVAGFVEGVAGAGAGFVVESSWSLSGPGGIFVGDSINPGFLTGSFSDSFARTVELTLLTNAIYTIAMRADAAVGFENGAKAHAKALIDPTFALGPGVNPLDFTFNFSAGIGNTPAAAPDPTPVPEPATGVLVLSGVAGAIVRRRRAARS